MNFLNAILPEHVLALLIFLFGVGAISWTSAKHANIFHEAAKKDAIGSVKEAGITFVSGHFLAYFLLPFALVIGASLAIVGKLDSGIAAIIGMCVGYIVNKVSTR